MKYLLRAFAADGTQIGRAACVQRGRRAGQWRVEVDVDNDTARVARWYVPEFADAVRELHENGAARVERSDL